MKTWRDRPMPKLFDEDLAAWRKLNPNDINMSWEDLGHYARGAYALHCDLGCTYAFLAGKGRLPKEMPDDCTPQGFYRHAVQMRCQAVGREYDALEVLPFCELSSFSQFIHRRMAERVAEVAGFKEDDDDHGLGDFAVDGDGDGLGDDGLE
jgi:hypothetical protein